MANSMALKAALSESWYSGHRRGIKRCTIEWAQATAADATVLLAVASSNDMTEPMLRQMVWLVANRMLKRAAPHLPKPSRDREYYGEG